MATEALQKKIKTAPQNPGCYLFKNSSGRIMYVGKAKNLHKRVPWYFKKENQIDKTGELVKNIATVEFIITDTELEALLLEAELIRRHQPKYNIDLKSGTRYAYIQITDEKYPRLVVTRIVGKNDTVFGPYTSGQARQEMIRLANRVFKVRVGKKLSKKDEAAGRIKLATAPWVEQISVDEYAKRIATVALLLKGKTDELITQLTTEMKGAASKNNFEIAKVKRDQILALQAISEKQKVQLHKTYNQDVINFVVLPDTFVVQLFNINKGVISSRREFRLPLTLDAAAARNLSDFICQYYFTEDIPQEVIVPIEFSEQRLVQEYLSDLAHRSVKITVPKQGDKYELLSLLQKNIEASINVGDASLFELQQVLKLSTLPRVIECFDISNLGPTNLVGSMVQFRDGKPDKNNYRRFKIKTVRGQSDFDSMREIIFRRYYRITKEKSQLPNLIMVDGGKPQLTAARQALNHFGLNVPLIALAKREEEIYFIGSPYPLRLAKTSAALKMLQRIRNEAHRFAITYQRLLRRPK